MVDTRHFATSGLQLPDKMLNPYKFSVWQATLQSIDSSFTTVVSFDTIEFDTGSNYSTSTHKFVAPINGYYYFDARISFASTSNLVELTFAVNGVQQKRGSFTTGSATTGSALLKLNANDYVQVLGYSSVTQNTITGTDPAVTFFQGFLVSAT